MLRLTFVLIAAIAESTLSASPLMGQEGFAVVFTARSDQLHLFATGFRKWVEDQMVSR